MLDQLCAIAYPYFLWSLLQSILQVLGSRYTNDKFYIADGLAVKLGLTENAIAIPLIAIIGTAASLSLAILLEKFNILPSVQKWGIFSLEIFVAHTIAASIFRFLLQKVLGFSEPLIHFILGTAIGIYAPIALSMISDKLGFKHMFTLRFKT